MDPIPNSTVRKQAVKTTRLQTQSTFHGQEELREQNKEPRGQSQEAGKITPREQDLVLIQVLATFTQLALELLWSSETYVPPVIPCFERSVYCENLMPVPPLYLVR